MFVGTNQSIQKLKNDTQTINSECNMPLSKLTPYCVRETYENDEMAEIIEKEQQIQQQAINQKKEKQERMEKMIKQNAQKIQKENLRKKEEELQKKAQQLTINKLKTKTTIRSKLQQPFRANEPKVEVRVIKEIDEIEQEKENIMEEKKQVLIVEPEQKEQLQPQSEFKDAPKSKVIIPDVKEDEDEDSEEELTHLDGDEVLEKYSKIRQHLFKYTTVNLEKFNKYKNQ